MKRKWIGLAAALLLAGALAGCKETGSDGLSENELFSLEGDSYLLDTPGFTSLSLPGLPGEEVREYFPEFEGPAGRCRFAGCLHVNEKEEICGVKQAVASGDISRSRYENYLQIYEEQKNTVRRYSRKTPE